MDRENITTPRLLSSKVIWNYALHNALTDLIYWNRLWFCVFRESDKHVFGANGQIRVLVSEDGDSWEHSSLIVETGIDLRDPKLSVTPENQLMLLIGGTLYSDQETLDRQPRVSFSRDGKSWSPLKKICQSGDWLWRITWHNNVAWGVSYRLDGKMILYKSSDGIDFIEHVEWKIAGKPNESTLRFLKDDTMVALVRRNFSKNGNAWIGISLPPYHQWKWHETAHHLGGPNFIIDSKERIWAAGRLVERTPYGLYEKTALCQMTLESLKTVLILPSGGIDCSYPGMVLKDNKLWISYYSSHEGRTAIYLAKVVLPEKS